VSRTTKISDQILVDVACTATTQCIAIGDGGARLTFDPHTPDARLAVDTGRSLARLACPSATQCTAVSSDGAQSTFNPVSFNSPPAITIDATHPLSAVACPSVSTCLAIGSGGRIREGDPRSPGAWPITSVQPDGLTAIACPTTETCIAVDAFGNETTATAPGSPPGNTDPGSGSPPGNTDPGDTDTDPGPILGGGQAPPPILAGPAPPETTVQLDRISAFTLTPSTFFANPKGPSATTAQAKQKKPKRTYGTVLRYTGSQAATTTFTVLRPSRGRKQGKTCSKPRPANRKGKACTYYSRVGSFIHQDAAGSVRFRFTGRVGGRTLKPGTYRLEAVARNTAGTATAVTKTFRVKKG
jgi:hypothetical protein